MAIEENETETVVIKRQERTWRLEIFTEKGEEPSVRAHRETIRTDAEGNVLSRDRGVMVDRSLSHVASETFSVGSKSYTGSEIAGVLAAIADIWRKQDIEAAASFAFSEAERLETLREEQMEANRLAAEAESAALRAIAP